MIRNSFCNFKRTMSFNTPPELLLRRAIQHDNVAANSTSSSSTYRAMMCSELSKPLQLKQLPREKEVPSGYVRLQVKSTGINFADILSVQGKYQEKPQLPYVPGSEMSGVISEVGSDVHNVKVGDTVFGMTPGTNGGFAEEAILPEMSVVPLDPKVPFDIAASVMCTYGTAYMALTRRGNIREGETVLVTAAAGGVGLACVDLAANVFKCKVIGACGGPEKCEIVKKQGAIAAIDYNSESMKDRVKELTDGKGADIIFDAVGGKIGEECIRCIAFEGRLLVIGFASGGIPKIPSNLLLVKSCSAVGVYWGSYSYRNPKAFMESIQSVARYLTQGTISPHVSKAFPLSQANEAFEYVATRKSTGKVVVNPQV